MADLREVVTSLGHTEVATYIQSGNVVFTSKEADTMALAAALERAIAGALTVRPRVVVLSRNGLAQVIADNPFPDETNPQCLHTAFGSEELGPGEVTAVAVALQRAREKGSRDEAQVVGAHPVPAHPPPTASDAASWPHNSPGPEVPWPALHQPPCATGRPCASYWPCVTPDVQLTFGAGQSGRTSRPCRRAGRTPPTPRPPPGRTRPPAGTRRRSPARAPARRRPAAPTGSCASARCTAPAAPAAVRPPVAVELGLDRGKEIGHPLELVNHEAPPRSVEERAEREQTSRGDTSRQLGSK